MQHFSLITEFALSILEKPTIFNRSQIKKLIELLSQPGNEPAVLAALSKITLPDSTTFMREQFTILYNQQELAWKNMEHLQICRRQFERYQETKNLAYMLGIPLKLAQLPNARLSLTDFYLLLQARKNFLRIDKEVDWRASLKVTHQKLSQISGQIAKVLKPLCSDQFDELIASQNDDPDPINLQRGEELITFSQKLPRMEHHMMKLLEPAISREIDEFSNAAQNLKVNFFQLVTFSDWTSRTINEILRS